MRKEENLQIFKNLVTNEKLYYFLYFSGYFSLTFFSQDVIIGSVGRSTLYAGWQLYTEQPFG